MNDLCFFAYSDTGLLGDVKSQIGQEMAGQVSCVSTDFVILSLALRITPSKHLRVFAAPTLKLRVSTHTSKCLIICVEVSQCRWMDYHFTFTQNRPIFLD